MDITYSTQTLNNVDDVDAFYSDLMYMPPALAMSPDGTRREIWVCTEDESFQLRELDGPGGLDRQVESQSFLHAFGLLRGAIVIERR